jgi:hypothetical protein
LAAPDMPMPASSVPTGQLTPAPTRRRWRISMMDASAISSTDTATSQDAQSGCPPTSKPAMA